MRHRQEQNFNLVINVISETAFLAVSLLYYYRMFKRCQSFVTPVNAVNSTFPMTTSNRVLAADCTASSSDSVILILKALAFALKIVVKLAANRCQPYRLVPQTDAVELLLVREQGNKVGTPQWVFMSKYPREIYQALLGVNIVMFVSLLFSSWLPTYNAFTSSNTDCPDFFSTCWQSLVWQQSISDQCNTQWYQWQKFSWARQFLVMVVVTFSFYQTAKIVHDALVLSECTGRSRIFSAGRTCWRRMESQMALPAMTLLFSESIALAYLLLVSTSKYPRGLAQLGVDYFSVAFRKVDSRGALSKTFTTFTIDLTKLDQKIFYGIIAAQLFALPVSAILSFFIKKYQSPAQIHVLSHNVGRYLRGSIEKIASAAPVITTVLFFSAACIAHLTETCYLDNFFHTLWEMFTPSSETILTGDKHNCSLYSVSAYQGSAILQTVLLLELLFALPTAALSLGTVLALCCNNATAFDRCNMTFFKQQRQHAQAIASPDDATSTAVLSQ